MSIERPKFRVDRLQGKSSPKRYGSVQVTMPGPRWSEPERVTVIDPESRQTSDDDWAAVHQDEEVLEMPAYTGPDDLPAKLRGELERGEYHVGGLIETFGVHWSQEKAARDVWQNFFDANGYSLSGIDAEITEEDGMYTVRITGDAIYDFRKLLHIGGTGKEGDVRAAGGFGEGSAVSSFVMLRDHGVESVDYESVGWHLNLALKDLPTGHGTEHARGLFAQLRTDIQRDQGNEIVIRTRNKDMVNALDSAKDLFYHDENPDFEHPSFDSSLLGFKVLLDQKGRKNQGHLYDAGQRRHFQEDDRWDRVDGLHFWSKRKTLPKDRDRGKVTPLEVDKHTIQPLVAESSITECRDMVMALEPLWDKAGAYGICSDLLRALCMKLEEAKMKIYFPKDCLASDVMTFDLDRSLLQAGYRLCAPDLKRIGMVKKSEKLRELESHSKLEVTERQQKKIETLQDMARLLGRTPKDVWLYSREQEKNISRGQYAPGAEYVWITTEELELDFSEAAATYIHELDHEAGKDATREHGSALTQSIGTVMDSMMKNRDEWERLYVRWHEV